MKIYIDLDDTLADTSLTIQKLFNYKEYCLNHHPIKKSFTDVLKDIKTWNYIKSNPQFWSNLPLSQFAQKIYQEACLITDEVYILTALPKAVFPLKNFKFKQAEDAKRVWLKSNFPNISSDKIIVCYAKEKHFQVLKNQENLCVLIDDSWRNILRWKNAGGLAIEVNNQDKDLSTVFKKLDYIKNYSNHKSKLLSDFSFSFK